MTDQAMPVDHDQAVAFLSALAPDNQLTFQTFPEPRFRDSCKQGATILHGDYESVCDQLSALNQQGHGIFLMVNQGDLKGRKASNVCKVRAHFVDLDDAPLEPVLSPEAPPHIVVESSPQKWHAYWLTDDSPLEEFKTRQKALALKFNGDPTVCDLPRVLRVPGFWHLKAQPFQSRLIKPSFTA